MRVLMLGWEFPPYISGGLGTACYGLTKALSHAGTDILFVLPRAVGSEHASHVRLLSPDRALHPASAFACDLPGVEFRAAPSRLASPYQSISTAQAPALTSGCIGHRDVARPAELPARPRAATDYGGNLLAEVDRYARTCINLARHESFDVIHAPDWMTHPAGLAIAARSGKPVAHSPLASTLREHATAEMRQMTWEKAADECLEVYRQVCGSRLLGGTDRSR